MERTGHLKGWSKRAPVGLVLLLMLMTTRASAEMTDSEEKKCPVGDYLTEEGICCNKCHAGFKLVEKCHSPGHRSNCTPCPPGQFMDGMNFARNCRSCKKCNLKRKEIVKSPCTPQQDTVCSCTADYYQYKIDSETFECLKCSTCGQDEIQKEPCRPNHNIVCGCKENFHKVDGKCEPCKTCAANCTLKCSPTTTLTTRGIDQPHSLIINALVGVVGGCIIMTVILGFIIYKSTKRHYKKKTQSLSSQPSDASSNSCNEVLIKTEEPSEISGMNSSAPFPVSEQDQAKLPDCVPLEINTADLIYTVLDLVPVQRVKQLVRCLGVTDTEIEQAEMDHRCCREAHYQILRMWADRGSRAAGGGRGGILHRPLLEELLDKLRQMHLGRAAEELETKYGIQ